MPKDKAAPQPAVAAVSGAIDEKQMAERVAVRVVELLRAVQSPVLTLAEAAAYAKHGSTSAFYVWARRWEVRAVPSANGRYSRRQIDRALEREAASAYRQRRARPQRKVEYPNTPPTE